jgi:hypothetical protein
VACCVAGRCGKEPRSSVWLGYFSALSCHKSSDGFPNMHVSEKMTRTTVGVPVDGPTYLALRQTGRVPRNAFSFSCGSTDGFAFNEEEAP